MPSTLLPTLVASLFAIPPAMPLAPSDRTEWPLAPREVRRHVVTLEPEEFVRVTVIQAGIDVTVRLIAPDGTAGPVVDANEGPRGWEPASILASTAGEHVIEVTGSAEAPAAGHYVVDADEVRVADSRDRRRLIAEAARAEAAVGLGPRAVYSRIGRPTRALITESTRRLPLAAGIFHALGETCWEADSLTFLALIQGWRHAHAEVFDLHPRALDLWEKCGDRYRHAEAHNYAAEGYARAMQYRRAAETYESGLAIAREDGARDVELLLLNNASSIYSILGETDKALRYAEEVLPEFRKRDIRLLEATSLRNLAHIHLRRGELEQATERATESLACFRRQGDFVGERMSGTALAEIYLALGEPETARRVLSDLLPAGVRSLDTLASSTVYFPTLARTYEETGDRTVALELLETALAVVQFSDNRAGQTTTLLTLGRFHLRDGAWDQAWEAADQASELLRPSGDLFDLADALELQGAAWLGQADLANARLALQESLELRRRMRDGRGEAIALQHLARVDLLAGDAPTARGRLEEALRLIEGARTRISSPDLRSTWLGNVRAIHEGYVETLMALHRREPGAGWDARALEASELSRARSLLDLIAESGTDIRQGADPQLLARERSLRDRLGARVEAQMRLLGTRSRSADGEDLAREIQELSMEYDDVRGRLRVASPRYAALTQPEPLDLRRIRSEVLDSETVLLEYALGAERSYLWIVGRDLFVACDLPGQAAIEAEVRRARRVIGRRWSDRADREALASLSRTLLGPARPHLANRRLLFVADCPLHHVPFGALPDERGRPLVTTHEVVSAPSASVVALLRAAERARPRARRSVAVLADPVFDREDDRVRAHGPAARTADVRLERATRDFGFEGGRLPRLAFTRREARSIQALAPASRVALDFEASRTAVQAPDLKDYRFLHFATHGLLNDARPELSGLVLSLVDSKGRPTRGLLTAPDVFNLDLGADLVVLSACRTALGREIRGEGLIGLTRAFMYAGAPRVVASLWPVDDLSTSKLMKSFYEGMLGPRKLRPAAALRRAQAEMASDARWNAPYFWAGFQLQGDWR